MRPGLHPGGGLGGGGLGGDGSVGGAFTPTQRQDAVGSSPSSSSSAAAGGWDARWDAPPLALRISDAKQSYGKRHSIYEKNWMPFASGDAVYAVQSLAPHHKVYRLQPDGAAVLQRPVTNTTSVFGVLGVELGRLHGGPPLVYVDLGRWGGALSDPRVVAAVKVRFGCCWGRVGACDSGKAERSVCCG